MKGQRVAWRRGTVRHRPTYVRMIIGIVILYAAIIIFGGSPSASSGRVVVLGYLLWNATRLRSQPGLWLWVWGGTAVAFGATVGLSLAGQFDAVSAIVAALSFLISCVVIALIGWTLWSQRQIDLAAVLGVLCSYLLLALVFASLSQFLLIFDSNYLNGVSGRPDPSDLLYFSVITITTVGYGDMVPGNDVARAVSVVEALTGQLYLVSVVAAVVGSWRASTSRDDASPDEGS